MTWAEAFYGVGMAIVELMKIVFVGGLGVMAVAAIAIAILAWFEK